MKSVKQCSKTLLAGDAGCRVTYCRQCRVAEIEVGAVSLRLEDAAFRSLAALLADAVRGLDAIHAVQEPHGHATGYRNVH